MGQAAGSDWGSGDEAARRAGSLGHLPSLAVTLGWALGEPASPLEGPCHAPHHLPATPEEEKGLTQQRWVTVCRGRHSHHSTDKDRWRWSRHADAKQRWGPHQGSSQLLHTALRTANKHGCQGSCILWPAFLIESNHLSSLYDRKKFRYPTFHSIVFRCAWKNVCDVGHAEVLS